MKALITSGGTKVKIDRVRSISNMSKGTFKSLIAEKFLFKNWDMESFSRSWNLLNPTPYLKLI